jgi:hypothetical protein
VAVGLLSKINSTRKQYGCPAWKPTERTLDFAIKSVAVNDPSSWFSSTESNILALAEERALERAKKASAGKRRRSPESISDDDGDSSEDEAKADERPKWTKIPLSADIKATIPPNWFGPLPASLNEKKEEEETRLKTNLPWAKVSLIKDENARKHLLAANAFSIKKNIGGGATLPVTFDPKVELEKLKKNKSSDPRVATLHHILSKDFPAIISRNTDVLRVLLTLLNNLDECDLSDIRSSIKDVLIPLVLDNNFRSTTIFQRSALSMTYKELSFQDDDSSASVTSEALPMMRRALQKAALSRQLDEAVKKAKPSSSSSSSSSSFSPSSRGRGGSFGRGRGRQTFGHNRNTGGGGGGGSGSNHKPSFTKSFRGGRNDRRRSPSLEAKKRT